MDKALEDKLFEKYPKLFSQKDLSAQETCLWGGLECSGGWYFLIDNLCNCIQNYININNLPQVEVVQVKNKFGMLRYYLNSSDPTIDGMIWLTEDISHKTCEICGSNKDVVHTSGHVRTLCGVCLKGEENEVT